MRYDRIEIYLSTFGIFFFTLNAAKHSSRRATFQEAPSLLEAD